MKNEYGWFLAHKKNSMEEDFVIRVFQVEGVKYYHYYGQPQVFKFEDHFFSRIVHSFHLNKD